jgi:hypothetical protein
VQTVGRLLQLTVSICTLWDRMLLRYVAVGCSHCVTLRVGISLSVSSIVSYTGRGLVHTVSTSLSSCTVQFYCWAGILRRVELLRRALYCVIHCKLHSCSQFPCAMPPNIILTCSVIDRNFANKLWNAGKYISNCLADSGASTSPITSTSLRDTADSSASTAQELAVTGPMTQQELNSLPVPERYIVSRCHEVVIEVTRLLEALSFSDAGRDIGCFVL